MLVSFSKSLSPGGIIIFFPPPLAWHFKVGHKAACILESIPRPEVTQTWSKF